MRQRPTKPTPNFLRDERGNIALVFGLTSIPLVFMMGMAVDFARAYYARSLLQRAADQAALAASIPQGLTDSQRVTAALNSFKANAAASPLTSGVTPCISINTATNCNTNGSTGGMNVTVVSNTGNVSISSSANVPTYFLSILSTSSLGIGAAGNATKIQKEVRELGDDHDGIERDIDGLDSDGDSAGHLGHEWGEYTLSPKWKGVWSTKAAPANYNDGKTVKVAVIVAGSGYSKSYSSTDSKTQAIAHCTQMKNNGVTIYAIGVGLGSTADDQNAKDVLNACASDTSKVSFPVGSSNVTHTCSQMATQIKGQANRLNITN